MTGQRLKIGIIGVQPGRSWAARAHIPALRALSDTFDIVGIANSTAASGQAAAAEIGVAKAFDGVADLIVAPEVDIVTVAVKVPPHFEIVKAAIEAGKHVYCEWPLGNGLAEAREMASLAKAKGVLGVVGTQARVAPEIEYLRHLIAPALSARCCRSLWSRGAARHWAEAVFPTGRPTDICWIAPMAQPC